MKEIIWEQIEPGDSVRLKYTGYPRVPLWLTYSWATVVRRNKRGNLVVQSLSEQEGYTRTVQPTDICEHEKKK